MANLAKNYRIVAKATTTGGSSIHGTYTNRHSNDMGLFTASEVENYLRKQTSCMIGFNKEKMENVITAPVGTITKWPTRNFAWVEIEVISK